MCFVQGGEKAGLSAKEAAKLAALDKSDKKGSSLDATTGSAREGSGNAHEPAAVLPQAQKARVWFDAGVAARSERPVAEPVQEPAPQPQRQQSGKKSKKKKKKK